MSLSDISTTISLDLYDHDLTPSKIKAIALDSKTRYINAQLTRGGQQYDIGQSTAVTLTIVRPDKTGVQVTGATYSYLVYIDGIETTVYGARAELTQTALAVSGALLAQFMFTSGEQILRSEIFTINNGIALDSTVSEWAGEYQGYNLDELVQNVNETVAKVDAMEQDVSELKEDLSDMNTATSGDVGKALKAKTVTDGKVTEWEFGEAGGGNGDTSEVVNSLMDDFYDFTEIKVTATRKGYVIEPVSGCFVANSTYDTLNFDITAGEIIKVESDYLWQFQSDKSTPAPTQTAVRIGDTHESGTFFVVAPNDATCVKVSTPATDGIGKCYVISGRLNSAVDEIDNFITNKAVASRLDMVTDVSSENSQQVADTRQSTVSAIGTWGYSVNNVTVDLSKSGNYYSNPFGTCQLYQAKFYDADGNALTLTQEGGSSISALGESGYYYRITLTHGETTTFIIRRWNSESDYKKDSGRTTTYHANGIIDHAVTAIRYPGSKKLDVGVTYEVLTKTYIPYGINLSYNEEFADAVWNRFTNERRFSDIPDGMLTPWMGRSHALSDNLLDDRKIDWNPNSTKYLKLKAGETIPVIGGKTIMCNKGLDTVKAINGNGVETTIGNKGAELPIVLPADAVAITFSDVWKTDIKNGYEPVYIYYVNTLYPYDDKNRNPLPMAQIQGYDINKNVYDVCIPEETSTLVRMMKTFAVRELNRQRNAYRFGTFNVFVQRQATNKEVIRKELETYGLDACGFQESQNYQSGIRYNLGDYLAKGWQFDYYSTAEESSASARHIVSALKIVSSEAFTIGTGSNTCLKCVIEMPRYKDYADGITTLSYYTYHGLVSSDSERTVEVNDILAKVAEDTSDFIIVCGDTNDFSGQPNYTHDRWKQFQAAGLTPVHDGSSETVTDRSCSIDNIFVSSNIKCLYYNVINSGDWMYTPPNATAPVPVSDHDLVYADLQFDFEAVINARDN